jgi:hypothetical protein
LKTAFAIETLKEGGLVEVSETGILYHLNEDGSRGNVAEDGSYELENGVIVIVKEGLIVKEDVKEDVKETNEVETNLLETETVIETPVLDEQMVLIQKLIEDYKSLEEKYKVLEDGLKSLEEKFSTNNEVNLLKEEVTKLSKQPKVSKPTEQKTKVLSIEDKAQHLLNNIKNLK